MEKSAPRKLHLISNAKSGRGAGGSLAEIASKLCQELGADFYNYQTHQPGELETQTARAISAAKSDGGIVAAAGGDGTIRFVAQKVQAEDLTFAVIPCGTFNYFARTHRIPEDPAEALRLALTGTSRPVRLGQINGEIFLINASLGLYAKAIREREQRTSRWGRNRIVVILSTILSLLDGHWNLEIDMITNQVLKRINTPMVFIGNNALQLRNLSMDVASCMKQDLLAMVTMKPLTKWEMLKMIFYGLAGKLENAEALDSFCVSSLAIHTKKKHHTVALDGELFKMTSPLKVEALPKTLNLILPPREG